MQQPESNNQSDLLCYLGYSDGLNVIFNFKATTSRIKHYLVVQTVKRLPAVQETRVQSLGWEDLLEKEMATHSSPLS